MGRTSALMGNNIFLNDDLCLDPDNDLQNCIDAPHERLRFGTLRPLTPWPSAFCTS
jgi:hypothetical protein